MENQNDLAFPNSGDSSLMNKDKGLTIREYTAIKIMQGYCANPETGTKEDDELVKWTLTLTDKLLSKL